MGNANRSRTYCASSPHYGQGNTSQQIVPPQLQGPQAQWFDVKVSTLPGAGRGVFAKRMFKVGEVVMQSPIVIYPKNEVKPGSTLSHYQGSYGDVAFLCFDYQGLVNMSNKIEFNNVRARWRLAEGLSEYVATQDIQEGEELFQHYSYPEIVSTV